MGKGVWIGLAILGAAFGLAGYGLYRVAVRYVDFGTASGELPHAVAAYRRAGLPGSPPTSRRRARSPTPPPPSAPPSPPRPARRPTPT